MEDRGLIGWDREANRYDAHPIIRSVAWQRVEKGDQKSIYKAMQSHFRPIANTIPNDDSITSLDDLTPAIELFHTLVGLGRFRDAFRLFKMRLDKATLKHLAAHRERINWLEQLFPDGLEEPSVRLTERERQLALEDLAHSYAAVGKPGEATLFYKKSLNINSSYHRLQYTLPNIGLSFIDSGSIRYSAGHFSSTILLTRYLQDESLNMAVKQSDYWISVSREALCMLLYGKTLSLKGDIDISRQWTKMGNSVCNNLGVKQQQYIAGLILGRQALMLGDMAEASAIVEQTLQLVLEEGSERNSIEWLSFAGQVALDLGNLKDVADYLNDALKRARTVNLAGSELQILIALSKLNLKNENFSTAKAYLEEVWEPALEGPYPLYQADAFNVLADICRHEGNEKGRVDAAVKAVQSAWCDGPPWAYHWGLERAKAHLQALGAPLPNMPPFDESKFEPLPDVEINPKDKYWVDPSVSLEALLGLEDGS